MPLTLYQRALLERKQKRQRTKGRARSAARASNNNDDDDDDDDGFLFCVFDSSEGVRRWWWWWWCVVFFKVSKQEDDWWAFGEEKTTTASSEKRRRGRERYSELDDAKMAAKSLSRGAFILFEGVDRCGKTTQASKLVDSLNQSGITSELWRYPDRTTTIGKMIDDYLQCKADSDDASMHLLFAANRWEKKKLMEEKLKAGVTLVVDRYGYSGVAFTTAKRLPGLDQQWCKHSETGLVKPDCLMYMEISEEAAKKRGGFGEERCKTTEMQKNVREVFADLREDWWNVVDADRTIEEVEKDVQKIAKEAVERCKKGTELQHFKPGW